MLALLQATPDTGFRVGAITEDAKYGDAPVPETGLDFGGG